MEKPVGARFFCYQPRTYWLGRDVWSIHPYPKRLTKQFDFGQAKAISLGEAEVQGAREHSVAVHLLYTRLILSIHDTSYFIRSTRRVTQKVRVSWKNYPHPSFSALSGLEPKPGVFNPLRVVGQGWVISKINFQADYFIFISLGS